MLSWRGKSDLHQLLSQSGPRLFTAHLPRPGNAGRLYQRTSLLLQDCQLLATVTRNAKHPITAVLRREGRKSSMVKGYEASYARETRQIGKTVCAVVFNPCPR